MVEDLSKYTSTGLLKLINDTKIKHDDLKKEIIDYTYEMDKLEKKINEKLKILTEIENEYVLLIEELNNKENVR